MRTLRHSAPKFSLNVPSRPLESCIAILASTTTAKDSTTANGSIEGDVREIILRGCCMGSNTPPTPLFHTGFPTSPSNGITPQTLSPPSPGGSSCSTAPCQASCQQQPQTVVLTHTLSPRSFDRWRREATNTSPFHATRLTTFLYLGANSDAQNASELLSRGITRILNVAEECSISPSCIEAAPRIQVKKIALRDHSDEDIAKHFDEALAFIHEAVISGQGVLVHCRFGVSRSATIAVAYLMKYGTEETVEKQHPMTYDAAFDHVKSRRQDVSPNLGFVLALHALDSSRGRDRSASEFAI